MLAYAIRTVTREETRKTKGKGSAKSSEEMVNWKWPELDDYIAARAGE